MQLRSRALGLAASTAALLIPAAVAQAATAVSSNWAGYAVAARSTKTRFRTVASSWVVPTGTCTSGQIGYSSTWVGLGGLAQASQALEQIGTEFDCNSGGRAIYSAWYELVPAGSRHIRMTVDPGDAMDASVTVVGSRVALLLRDRTRAETFKRTLAMSDPDVSSAEWIIEAPANCDATGSRCVELPVADFGTQSFSRASLTTLAGHRGAISDPHWSTTKTVLNQGGNYDRFADAASTGGALPSDLSSDGSAFSVSYSAASTPGPGQPPKLFPGGDQGAGAGASTQT